MKRFSLAADILISLAGLPLLVILYMYAGHTTYQKPKQNAAKQKTEQKPKEISKNTENALPQSSQKIFYLNKISTAGISKEDVLSPEDSTIKMFKVLIRHFNHDTSIYLIVPPVQQIDSIRPI